MNSAGELRAVAFLRDLPADALETIATQLTVERIDAGQTLFAAGDPADSLFLVETGFLEAIEPGSRRPLASLGPGSVVGELGLLLDEPRAATVRAVTDAELRRLARPVVDALVQDHPNLAVALGREVGRRLLAADRRGEGTAPRLVTVPGAGAATLATAVTRLGVNVGLLPLDGAKAAPPDVELLRVLAPDEIVDLVSVPQPGLDVVIAAMPADPTTAASAAARAADHGVDIGGVLPEWATTDLPRLRRLPTRPGPLWLLRVARLVSGRAIGLALSSGGSKTVAHLGVMRVLREAGITIDAMAGTSGGAVCALTFAMETDDAGMVRNLEDIPGAFSLRHLGPKIPPRHGLFRGNGVYDMVKRWYPDGDLATAPLPLYVVAADLETGAEVVLDRGPMPDALRASVSIPGVLEPWRVDGRLLVDGGIVSPLPTRVLRDAGVGFVIASNVAGQDAPLGDRVPRITETMGRMVSAMERELLTSQVALADVHIRPIIRTQHSFDFKHMWELVDIGEAAARECVPELERLVRQAHGEDPPRVPLMAKGAYVKAPQGTMRDSFTRSGRSGRWKQRLRSVRMASSFVWLTSVRDMRWRWRRFMIASTAAALVLGMTVLLTGIVANLNDEIRRTVDATGADGFVVAAGVPGPFTSMAPISLSQLDEVATRTGVEQADAAVFIPQTLEGKTPIDSYVIGFAPGGLGTPPVAEGRVPTGPGEAAVDSKAAIDLGEEITVGGQTFKVVGTTEGLTVLGERPNIYITLGAARSAFFRGESVATTFLLRGHPQSLPPGLAYLDLEGARADLRRPLADTIDSIALFRSLLWIVAAAIVGSVLYLSALERARDMAVLKATGASGRDLAAGLVLQAVTLSLTSSIVAIGVAEALKPVFPAGISLPIPLLLTAPLVALAVGIIGSLAGLRRVLRVDPALAFGGP